MFFYLAVQPGNELRVEEKGVDIGVAWSQSTNRPLIPMISLSLFLLNAIMHNPHVSATKLIACLHQALPWTAAGERTNEERTNER